MLGGEKNEIESFSIHQHYNFHFTYHLIETSVCTVLHGPKKNPAISFQKSLKIITNQKHVYIY